MTTVLCCWNLYRPGSYSNVFRFTLLGMVAIIGALAILLRVPVSLVALAVLVAWLPYISLKFRDNTTAFGLTLAFFAFIRANQDRINQA